MQAIYDIILVEAEMLRKSLYIHGAALPDRRILRLYQPLTDIKCMLVDAVPARQDQFDAGKLHTLFIQFHESVIYPSVTDLNVCVDV